jgi:chemotaxis protein MotB
MPREAKILAAALMTLLVVGVLAFQLWRRNAGLAEHRAQLEQARFELAQAHATLADQLARWQTLTSVVAEAQVRIAGLEREKDELAREKEAIVERQRSLEGEMRQALASKEVTISELQGRLTVDILDHVLFDSGEASLKPEGEEVLRRVAGVLAQFPSRQVHVIGHTDNVPIRAAARNRFASNWELSTARATAAVRFLSEQAGVDPRRLGAVGYGEFRPVADNATPEGRAQNRRIALVVLSEELAGADTAVTARRVPAPVEPEADNPAPTMETPAAPAESPAP